jgi:hypothetical protein
MRQGLHKLIIASTSFHRSAQGQIGCQISTRLGNANGIFAPAPRGCRLNTNGVGVDFPGVSSTRSHGAGVAEQHGSPGPRRTRMRPLVVKRPTTPRSGLLLFFRRVGLGAGGLRFRALTAFPSLQYRQPLSAPHTSGGALALALARAEAHEPLRPRNISVPSYRPPHQGGDTGAVRQCAAGAGEGQYTSALGDHRRRSRSRSGGPITRRGLRGQGLGAPGRARTPCAQQGRALS